MRYLALIGVLLLGGCVTADEGYVRASGRTNPEHLRLALAECQGEAAATPRGFWVEGFGVAGLARKPDAPGSTGRHYRFSVHGEARLRGGSAKSPAPVSSTSSGERTMGMQFSRRGAQGGP